MKSIFFVAILSGTLPGILLAAQEDDVEIVWQDEIFTTPGLAEWVYEAEVGDIKNPKSLLDAEVRRIADDLDGFYAAYKKFAKEKNKSDSGNLPKAKQKALDRRLSKLPKKEKAEHKKGHKPQEQIPHKAAEIKKTVPASGYTLADIQAVKLPASKHFTGNQARQLKSIFTAALNAKEFDLAQAVMNHMYTAQNHGGAVYLDMQRELAAAKK